nr:hypothetical protein [Tanacetum cinerariifolium]
MELAITKCLNSPEYLSALGAVIGKAIEKGMQDGLSARISHGKEGRVLTDVAAYNPSAKGDYISALQQLQNVNFSLLAELKSNKDSSVKNLMNILCLKEAIAERLGLNELQPHVDQLMVPIHHSPDKTVIDHLARSLLIQGLPNDIYYLIDSNETAKDLWDALERQMRGSKYGEQDRKATILYEYETFKAIEGEQLVDTYLCYVQVINDLKKCGYKKDNCELNYKFLNNLQPEWKQYGTLMRQTKNLMDINIDALYNIPKQNQGDVNDDLGYKKKVVVVTSDPLALVAEKTKVNKRKEKVEVQSESEESDDKDISDLKKITALLAKAFNRKKYYAKPTNNNLRTSSVSSSANKKPEYVKLVEKKEDKKVDEKKRDMSKIKCYNCKKEGHFAKDCKKAKVKDYNYYKTKMLLAKKDSDKQVLLAEDQAWMESSSNSDQEINANMVFMAQIEK